jgi:hypothetical protein
VLLEAREHLVEVDDVLEAGQQDLAQGHPAHRFDMTLIGEVAMG